MLETSSRILQYAIWFGIALAVAHVTACPMHLEPVTYENGSVMYCNPDTNKYGPKSLYGKLPTCADGQTCEYRWMGMYSCCQKNLHSNLKPGKRNRPPPFKPLIRLLDGKQHEKNITEEINKNFQKLQEQAVRRDSPLTEVSASLRVNKKSDNENNDKDKRRSQVDYGGYNSIASVLGSIGGFQPSGYGNTQPSGYGYNSQPFQPIVQNESRTFVEFPRPTPPRGGGYGQPVIPNNVPFQPQFPNRPVEPLFVTSQTERPQLTQQPFTVDRRTFTSRPFTPFRPPSEAQGYGNTSPALQPQRTQFPVTQRPFTQRNVTQFTRRPFQPPAPASGGYGQPPPFERQTFTRPPTPPPQVGRQVFPTRPPPSGAYGLPPSTRPVQPPFNQRPNIVLPPPPRVPWIPMALLPNNARVVTISCIMREPVPHGSFQLPVANEAANLIQGYDTNQPNRASDLAANLIQGYETNLPNRASNIAANLNHGHDTNIPESTSNLAGHLMQGYDGTNMQSRNFNPQLMSFFPEGNTVDSLQFYENRLPLCPDGVGVIRKIKKAKKEIKTMNQNDRKTVSKNQKSSKERKNDEDKKKSEALTTSTQAPPPTTLEK